MTSDEERALVTRAQKGDERAFQQLARENSGRLRSVLRRMVGPRDVTDDLEQETWIKAHAALESFEGRARFSTWLCAIGARLAVDYLRQQKRWRVQAQNILAAQALERPELGGAVYEVLNSPAHEFDVREHVAYCWTCVGRTLEPDLHAALVLRELCGFSNDEAAAALGISVSVLRHHLRAGREAMQASFEGLCALVNKQGTCYQCKGLRDGTPEERRGVDLVQIRTLDERMRLVEGADLDRGKTQLLHDLFFSETAQQEAEERGDPAEVTDCGRL